MRDSSLVDTESIKNMREQHRDANDGQSIQRSSSVFLLRSFDRTFRAAYLDAWNRYNRQDHYGLTWPIVADEMSSDAPPGDSFRSFAGTSYAGACSRDRPGSPLRTH